MRLQTTSMMDSKSGTNTFVQPSELNKRLTHSSVRELQGAMVCHCNLCSFTQQVETGE